MIFANTDFLLRMPFSPDNHPTLSEMHLVLSQPWWPASYLLHSDASCLLKSFTICLRNAKVPLYLINKEKIVSTLKKFLPYISIYFIQFKLSFNNLGRVFVPHSGVHWTDPLTKSQDSLHNSQLESCF